MRDPTVFRYYVLRIPQVFKNAFATISINTCVLFLLALETVFFFVFFTLQSLSLRPLAGRILFFYLH